MIRGERSNYFPAPKEKATTKLNYVISYQSIHREEHFYELPNHA